MLLDEVTIAEITGRDITSAHDLVMKEFDAFIGKGYSSEGCENFRKLITPEYIAKLPERNGFSLVAKYQERVIGLFSMRDVNFITLFFVDREFHNKGIGKRLFFAAKSIILKKNKCIEKLEVHASPYAEKIYYALGFIKTGDEKEEAGIRFVPMEYKIQQR